MCTFYLLIQQIHIFVAFFIYIFCISHVSIRRLLNWSRCRCGGASAREEWLLVRGAQQPGPPATAWAWPTPLRTTPGASWPAAPCSPGPLSRPPARATPARPACPPAATRSRALPMWAAARRSVRTAAGTQTLTRLSPLSQCSRQRPLLAGWRGTKTDCHIPLHPLCSQT